VKEMEFLRFVVKAKGFPCPRYESTYPVKEGMCPLGRQLDLPRDGPDSLWRRQKASGI